MISLHTTAQQPPANAKIYYTDLFDGLSTQPILNRIGWDGSGLTNLVSGLSHPRGIALDVAGGKMYWTEPGIRAIRRANLDGTGIEFLLATADSAGGIALDVAAGKLYWTGGISDPRVRRSNLNGTGVEDLITTGQIAPVGITIDTIRGKLYWTDLEGSLNGTGSIKRSNLNGSNVETLLTGIDEANGVACDAVAGKIYWTETRSKKIQRANLDGTDLKDLVVGLLNPTTISLDLVARKMYWTDSRGIGTGNRILKANLDGSNIETVVNGGFPWGIAVDDGSTECSPHKAKATAQIVNGFLVGYTITDPGCGYTNAPAVLIQGGGGNGATATATVRSGQVTAINITSAGCCYTSVPNIAIGSPPFVPTVSIAVSKVKVTQNVVLGRTYVLQASIDLVTWITTGPPFFADSETIVSEFDVDVSGRFYRISQVAP